MTIEKAVQPTEPESDPVRPPAAATPFAISTSQNADVYVMALAGELDVSTAPLLRERLAELSGELTSDLVLDIGLLTFIDSTGLALIVAQHKKLKAGGFSLLIASPTRMARRLFEISGLTSILSIEPESEPV